MVAASREKHSSLFAPVVLCLAALAGCKAAWNAIRDYRESFADGSPMKEGQLVGGKQTGSWKIFYPSGRTKAEGMYKDDLRFGPWMYFYEDGTRMWEGRFDAQGLRTGRYVSYHPNDVVQARGDYVEDQPDGWWRYYRADGSMVREGAWERGRQSGLWRYYYASGARQMEGLYVDNEMVGPWQVWDPRGVTTIRDNGSRAGFQLVREVWPETQQVRRAGARKNGRAVGRWVSFHPNGQPRFRAGLDGEALVGTFDARNADGGVFAEGRLAANTFAAGCTIVVDGKIQGLGPGPFEPLSATVNVWQDPSEGSLESPAQRLARWAFELQGEAATAAYVAIATDPAAAEKPLQPAAADEIAAEVQDGPQQEPAREQIWTLEEKERVRGWWKFYIDGRRRGAVNPDAYAAGPVAPRGGSGRRSELEGRPLKFQVLTPVTGGEIDLAAFQGKKRVLLVVLRGFLGKVCEYCVAQTAALADAKDELDALDVEVLVIYPGARENVAAFEALYEEEFGEEFGEGPPPYKVFYDQDLKLVRQLGIEGDLASPSTFLINKQGLVEFAYVGKNKADRPATNKLKKLIAELDQ